MEYIASEIWEVCIGKTLPDLLVILQKGDVFKSINRDDELHQLFKVLAFVFLAHPSQSILEEIQRQSEEETQAHTDNIVKLISSLPKDSPVCGAEEKDLTKVESEIYFEMYPPLKTLLRFSNGIPSYGIDSASSIFGIVFIYGPNSPESITYYTELTIVYAQTNWIPLRTVIEGEVWDCLDVNTSVVVRFSVIPPEGDAGEVEEIRHVI